MPPIDCHTFCPVCMSAPVITRSPVSVRTSAGIGGAVWYVAPDWTADWLHRESVNVLDDWSVREHGQRYDALAPEGQAALRQPLSRQELADMTGTTIETCIRIMSRWGKDEVVRTDKNGFTVIDTAALEVLANA